MGEYIHVPLISVTLETSQSPMGWSNSSAPENIPLIARTFEVSQPLMLRLNAVPLKRPLICVTLEVFQAEM